MQDKAKIIKTLTDFGRLAAYRVAGIIGMNISKTLTLLAELEKEGKVVRHEETMATYWEVVK